MESPSTDQSGTGRGSTLHHYILSGRDREYPGDSDTGPEQTYADCDQRPTPEPRRQRPTPCRVLYAIYGDSDVNEELYIWWDCVHYDQVFSR